MKKKDLYYIVPGFLVLFVLVILVVFGNFSKVFKPTFVKQMAGQALLKKKLIYNFDMNENRIKRQEHLYEKVKEEEKIEQKTIKSLEDYKKIVWSQFSRLTLVTDGKCDDPVLVEAIKENLAKIAQLEPGSLFVDIMEGGFIFFSNDVNRMYNQWSVLSNKLNRDNTPLLLANKVVPNVSNTIGWQLRILQPQDQIRFLKVLSDNAYDDTSLFTMLRIMTFIKADYSKVDAAKYETFFTDKIKSKDSDKLAAIGSYFHALDNREKGKYFLDKALEFDPRNKDALYNLVLFYYGKDSAEAKKYAEMALSFGYEHPRFYDTIGHYYDIFDRNPTLAIYYYKKALDFKDPEFYHIGIGLSKLYEKIGDMNAAIECLESVYGTIKIWGKDRIVLNNLIDLCERAGQKERADKWRREL